MNAANEIAVEAFLNKEIKFVQIYELVREVLNKYTPAQTDNIDSIINLDNDVRNYAYSLISKL